MTERNLHILPRFSDVSGFLYIEHAAVERSDSAVIVRTKDHSVELPVASIATLVLGPGTTVSHGAMVVLAECGAGIVWSGAEMQRCYAIGGGRTRSAENLFRQAHAWADETLHMTVVRRMYQFRFPEPLPANLSLQQIRGREGVRVRESYAKAAKEYEVDWKGRNYDRRNWGQSDSVNRALSAGAACLYGVCHCAIEALGYSSGLGFIHTGKQLSFVYDIADLYKAELLIPAAFFAAGTNPDKPEGLVRAKLRELGRERRLVERLAVDLPKLFDDLSIRKSMNHLETDISEDCGDLWDQSGFVTGGEAYGRDDS